MRVFTFNRNMVWRAKIMAPMMYWFDCLKKLWEMLRKSSFWPQTSEEKGNRKLPELDSRVWFTKKGPSYARTFALWTINKCPRAYIYLFLSLVWCGPNKPTLRASQVGCSLGGNRLHRRRNVDLCSTAGCGDVCSSPKGRGLQLFSGVGVCSSPRGWGRQF